MVRNPNDITAYRKKEKRRKNITRLIAMAVVLIITIFIWTQGEAIFEPLRGIANRIGTGETGEGFPIMLPGSADFSMNNFGNAMLLLSDTYLYTYNEKGGQIFAYRHNYSRPFQRATDRRILLFDLNAYDFSLFNRNSRIYEVKLEDKIVLAELSQNNSAAIVTASAAFSNILYIYDGNGKWQYTRRFVDEEVNAVCFNSHNNELIVAASTVRNGQIVSKIYLLRTDTNDDVIWEITLPADAWALNIYKNGNYITVLADNMIFSLNPSNGEIIGSYRFESGRLVKPVFGKDFNLVILADYVTGKTLYVTLDEKSNFLNSEIMPFEAKKVEIYGEIVYTLTGGSVKTQDKFLSSIDAITLTDEYTDFILSGKNALLLGYETVEKAALN